MTEQDKNFVKLIRNLSLKVTVQDKKLKISLVYGLPLEHGDYLPRQIEIDSDYINLEELKDNS